MNEGSKVLLNHPVHAFSEDGELCLKEFVAWITPLLDRLFDESSGNNEWVIIGELPRLGPVLYLSGRKEKGGKIHSL